MDQACREQYQNGADANPTEDGNPWTWTCYADAGNALGGVYVQGWCDRYHPGSNDTLVGSDAWSWRCELKT
jgi:hypothetical protein